MSKVVIFGVGQWAELAHFYLTHDSPHEVAAFTLDRDYIERWARELGVLGLWQQVAAEAPGS